MKRIFTFLMLFTIASTALGQGSSKAQKLLDEVSAKLNSYENMYVEFKYVLDNKKENVHQETRGNATMKGDLYNVNFLGSNQLYDGKKIYTIIPEDEEVNIADVDVEEDDTLTPSKFFSFYKNGFTYDWAELKNINGRKIQYVKLNPIDSNSPIAKVLLGIDVNTKHIYNLIETGKNTTVTTLTVTQFKHDQTLSNSLFSFDEAKYKARGYLINKL
jgi:outer membrane lipoprotein-sorting protein